MKVNGGRKSQAEFVRLSLELIISGFRLNKILESFGVYLDFVIKCVAHSGDKEFVGFDLI